MSSLQLDNKTRSICEKDMQTKLVTSHSFLTIDAGGKKLSLESSKDAKAALYEDSHLELRFNTQVLKILIKAQF